MKSFYLWLAFAVLFTLGLADNTRGPVFPDLLRDFALDNTQGSFFFFLASTASLVNNLGSAWWLPRLGPYRGVQVYLGLMLVGLLFIGLGPTFPLVLVGAALFGLSLGGLGILVNIVVGRSAAPERRRQAFSALHCTYGAASLFAPLLVSWVARLGASWNWAFPLLALMPLSLLLLSLRRDGRELTAATGEPPAVVPAYEALSGGRGIWRRTFWVAMLTAGYVASELLISTRFVLLARREFAADLSTANRGLAWFFALLFLGRLYFAIARPAMRLQMVLVVSAALSLICFVLGLFFGPLWIVLAGAAMAPFFPSVIALIHDEFGEARDFALSWTLTSVSLGLMAMHPLVGALTDRFGLLNAMWVGPACLAVSLSFLALKRCFL